jgi:hypothetical protein
MLGGAETVDLVSIAQIASAVGTVGLTILFGFQLMVFRKQVAVNSDTLREMQESRLAQERPQVIVLAEYRQRRVIEVVVRNIGRGAAKDITFEFSAPLESSISDQEHPEVIPRNELPYFQEGLNFLAPGAEIGVIWDTHENLLPLLRERGLENGITATSRYESLTGDQYETSWVINPLLIAAERYASELDRDSE